MCSSWSAGRKAPNPKLLTAQRICDMWLLGYFELQKEHTAKKSCLIVFSRMGALLPPKVPNDVSNPQDALVWLKSSSWIDNMNSLRMIQRDCNGWSLKLLVAAPMHWEVPCLATHQAINPWSATCQGRRCFEQGEPTNYSENLRTMLLHEETRKSFRICLETWCTSCFQTCWNFREKVGCVLQPKPKYSIDSELAISFFISRLTFASYINLQG